MSVSRPNMAKDVIKKKQRIAHNKTNDGHEIYPEYDDFLTSIMQEMDNTDLMAAMCLGNIQTNLSETSKTTFQEKTQSSINQIPSRTHASLPKLKKYGIPRKGPLMAKSQKALKQLQHNRKLPKPRAHLAGLSNSEFDKPSVKSKTKVVNNARSIGKFNNKGITEKQVYNRIAVDGNKMKRHSSEESKSKEMTSKKLKPVTRKICPVKESSHVVESMNLNERISKQRESAIVKKKSPEQSSHIINNSDKIADNSSDSDEYEKFIKREKKDLPKKSKKKVSENIKSVKKVSRQRASKSVSTESESDLSDEESSNSYKSKKMRKTLNMLDNRESTSSIKDKVLPKIRKCKSRTILKSVSPSSDSEVSDDEPSTSYKKRKKVHKKLNKRLSDTSKEDSESQMDIYDEAYHNSSESDDLPSPSEIMQGLLSTNNQFSGQMDNQHKSKLSFHTNEAYNIPRVASREDILCNKTFDIASLVSSNQPNILQSETSSNEIPNIASMVSSDQPNVLHKSSDIQSLASSDQPNVLHKSSDIHSLVGSAQPNVSHKTPDLPPVDSVRPNAECVALQNNSVSSNSWQENSPKLLIVDLAESDNECESSFTIIPKIVKTSSQNQNDSQSYSDESEVELIDVIVPPDLPVSSEHSDKNAAFTKKNSQLNIKTEKVCETTRSIAESQNTKSNPESQTSLISKKYEVAYTTGICQKPDEENESKDNVRKQLNLNNDKLNNEKSKLIESNIVKQLNLNNELQSSIVSNAKDSLVLNKVKEEPCDDLEIILDTTTSSNSSTSLSNKEIHSHTSIKVEKDSKAVKQATAIHNISKDPIGTRESGVVANAKNLLKVKKETSDGDECEIILETTSTNNSSTNLSNVQIHSNRSIKVERDCKAVKQAAIHIASDGSIGTRENSKLTEKEQKLHEIPCSTLTNLTTSHNKMVQPLENETINELHPLNIKALLENLKKEFATYQEILVTEQSVETTFKLLEKCQAERLKSLKTKIIQCLESVPSNSDCNSIKIAMNKLLDSSELSSSTCLKDGTKISSVCPSESSTTSDISMQDLKALATMNLVPLSSISETDIKPNLSELQCAVKQEQSPSYEINSMSFGEKCIVCSKDASAACQQCAKVFFCSNECGRKYWEDGHKNACIK